jgi:TadE-like protein
MKENADAMATTTDVRERRNSPRSRRGRGERGSVILESAIGLPILFLLIFGVMEIGMAIKSYSGAANAVSAGGRAGSVAGNDAAADQAILARIARESAGIGKGEIQYVVIWHASGPGTTVPSGCLPSLPTTVNTSSVGVSDGNSDAIGACNVYRRPNDAGGAFQMATGGILPQPPDYYFGCTDLSDPAAAHKVDCNWPGKNRVITTTARGYTGTPHSPDYLGVYIKADHRYITGILGGNNLTITDSSINLLEPQGYST